MTSVRNFFGLLFLVGVFQMIREWRYSRTHRLPITRMEKLGLASAVILSVPLQLALEKAVLSVEMVSGLGMAATGGLFFNAWAIRRRLRRTEGPKT